VRGPIDVFERRVGFRISVFVLYHQADGSTQGFSFEKPGFNQELVRLFSLGANGRLTGSPSLKIVLYSWDIEMYSSWAAFHNRAQAPAM